MRRIMRTKILFIAISAAAVLADVPLAPAHPVRSGTAADRPSSGTHTNSHRQESVYLIMG